MADGAASTMDDVLAEWEAWKKAGVGIIERCYRTLLDGTSSPETVKGIIKDVAGAFGTDFAQSILESTAAKIFGERGLVKGSQWLKCQLAKSGRDVCPLNTIVVIHVPWPFHVMFRVSGPTSRHLGLPVEEFYYQFRPHADADVLGDATAPANDATESAKPVTPVSNDWIRAAIAQGLEVGSKWRKHLNTRRGRSYRVGTVVVINKLCSIGPGRLQIPGQWVLFSRDGCANSNRCCDNITDFLAQYSPVSALFEH